MADDKRNQDNLSEEDRSRVGQMGGHSGQKGGQSQSDYNAEDTNSGMAKDPTADTSLNDEDL